MYNVKVLLSDEWLDNFDSVASSPPPPGANSALRPHSFRGYCLLALQRQNKRKKGRKKEKKTGSNGGLGLNRGIRNLTHAVAMYTPASGSTSRVGENTLHKH